VEALPAILDEWNCAAVKLADGRIYRCVGRGAGGAATAEAIVADLYELLGTRLRANSRTGARTC
jgi:homoserine dehydrogenase